jgi:hypothetical protein
MKKRKFATFDTAALDATCEAWTNEAASGKAFPSEVEQLLAWVRTHTEHVDGDSTAFGIFPEGSNEADGICEVVLSRLKSRSPWVKHLKLRLRPSIDDRLFNSESDAVTAAIEIFAQSIVGVMRLKLTHSATTLKVYGRTKEQLNFLQQAVLAMSNVAKKHSIAIEGRFLVISNLTE